MVFQVLVTSYENPDLDGTACAMGYAEYLQKKGRSAEAVVFGNAHREVQFVLKTFSITPPKRGEALLQKDTPIILVDASDTRGISSLIQIQNVIEIIDHRKVNDAGKFLQATAHIDLVGACATIIAEKFYHNAVAISSQSAGLLYSAIISNTVNFTANVTTDRDKKMADWLLTKCNIPSNYIHDMFYHKSQFTKPLFETLMDDVADFTFGGKRIGIFQLEIVLAEDFIKKNKKDIQACLQKLQQQGEFDFVFLTCIDIEKAENWFVINDESTGLLLQNTLNIHFINYVANMNGVMMRKTITPLLKDFLESQ